MAAQQAPEQRYILYPSANIAKKIGVEGYRWLCNVADCINMRENLDPPLVTQGSIDQDTAAVIASYRPRLFYYRPIMAGITEIDIVDSEGKEAVYYPGSTLVHVEGYSQYTFEFTEVVNPLTGNYSRIQFITPLPFDTELSPSGSPVIVYYVPAISI